MLACKERLLAAYEIGDEKNTERPVIFGILN